MSMQTLAKYLRSLRPEGKPSLREIARRCDLSHAYLAKLEVGKFESVGFDTLRKVATGYGVPREKLLAIAGVTPEKPLPELDVYLRTKFGLTDEGIQEAEAFVGYIRQRYGKKQRTR